MNPTPLATSQATQNVVLRCDAHENIGFGHLRRCLALAQALRASGDAVHFIMRASTEACQWVQPQAHSAQYVSSPTADLGNYRRAYAEERTNWLVLDVYEHAAHEAALARAIGYRVLRIDDWGQDDVSAHMILNTRINASAGDYGTSRAILLLGARYALLDRAFTNTPAVPIRPAVRTVVLTLGGADRHNRTETLMRLWAQLPESMLADTSWHIVLGPGYQHEHSLRNALSLFKQPYQLHRAPDGLLPLLQSADLIVSAAGTTLFECAALGLPTLAVILAENQKANAEAFHRAGCVLNLGWVERLQPEVLEAAWQAIAATGMRMALQQQGRSLVDGQGAPRVRAAMLRGEAV
jgi:UDP-2,4-diacetamido-2,4,6-trideoxy-beta-L-altropyranose hydrolase